MTVFAIGRFELVKAIVNAKESLYPDCFAVRQGCRIIANRNHTEGSATLAIENFH